jgi:hypothetical protein
VTEYSGVDMTQLINRKKRSKLTRILISPIMLIVFMAGWGLYCIGQPSHHNFKQPHKPSQNKRENQDEIEFSMISQEEQMIAI